ncbi:ABC transporter permease [Demequina sp. TTPB684]|uniref:ABC transporter permease n=1 Tax=unclassified Demequina TaxID=2620311 RepID=UPI001CF53E48|nr:MULTISPECIES: ABC transporter permease [unclassified Demequina]MCB2412755.1 ABC transporter permease [Demequina sp. TTPB684]UPU88868.1 ABC transporter permease [Demequina sp. TMPB413]
MTATLSVTTVDETRNTVGQASALAGLPVMARLTVRRNRVRLAVWTVVLVGMFAYIASYYQTLFPTQAALDDFAAVSNTPGIKALTGLSPAADTLGGAVWTKGWMTIALSLAIGVAFLVTRSGRADEEVGRTELLRSRMLGIHAYSSASWLVNGLLCLAVGAGIAVASAANGLDPEGTGIAGSLVFGASVTGVGLVGLGVGAVAGQIASTSRGANALASTVIIVAYVLRMMGDLGNGVLTWFSPIGWGQHMQPYAGNRWWPLVPLIVLSAALLAVAMRIESRRDHGSGLLVERAGPSEAPRRMVSPLGLGLRLQRGPIIGWTIAVVVTALLFGSIVDTMNTFMADAGGAMTDFTRGIGVDALLAMLAGMIALVSAVFATQSAVSLRTDEANGIVETQLAGALSRTAWALKRLVIPTVGSAVLLLLGGAGLGAVYGSTTGDSSQVAAMAGAALAYWPAVMILVGIAVALFGWAPSVAIPVTWGAMASMWFATMLGEVFGLPTWLLDALPFSAVPYMPLEAMSWTPLVIMTAVAAALIWTGVDRFSRRDVRPG